MAPAISRLADVYILWRLVTSWLVTLYGIRGVLLALRPASLYDLYRKTVLAQINGGGGAVEEVDWLRDITLQAKAATNLATEGGVESGSSNGSSTTTTTGSTTSSGILDSLTIDRMMLCFGIMLVVDVILHRLCYKKRLPVALVVHHAIGLALPIVIQAVGFGKGYLCLAWACEMYPAVWNVAELGRDALRRAYPDPTSQLRRLDALRTQLIHLACLGIFAAVRLPIWSFIAMKTFRSQRSHMVCKIGAVVPFVLDYGWMRYHLGKVLSFIN